MSIKHLTPASVELLDRLCERNLLTIHRSEIVASLWSVESAIRDQLLADFRLSYRDGYQDGYADARESRGPLLDEIQRLRTAMIHIANQAENHGATWAADAAQNHLTYTKETT